MMNNMSEMINTSQNFENLLTAANSIQEKCRDFKVSVNDLRMTNDLKLRFGDQEMPLSQLATGHLCGKLNIPSRYFSRLVDSGNNFLAADNVNCWLNGDKRTFFLRGYEDHIRGVLSGSYSVYDAPEILATVKEVFNPEGFVLKGSFINEERLHLRLIENQMLDIDGEDLYAGITLDSSDVGRSGLNVRFFIWKRICTNGLVIAKSNGRLFRQKHVGITHDDFATGLEEGLGRFYEIKEAIAESIRETSKIPMNKDINDLVEEIKEKTNLSDKAAEKVVELMEVKYAPTRWGLINGITEVAQDFTLETRIQLEEIAGSMLV